METRIALPEDEVQLWQEIDLASVAPAGTTMGADSFSGRTIASSTFSFCPGIASSSPRREQSCG